VVGRNVLTRVERDGLLNIRVPCHQRSTHWASVKLYLKKKKTLDSSSSICCEFLKCFTDLWITRFKIFVTYLILCIFKTIYSKKYCGNTCTVLIIKFKKLSTETQLLLVWDTKNNNDCVNGIPWYWYTPQFFLKFL
jgi:hypothetical protein